MDKSSKISTWNNKFYTPILTLLKTTTNLTEISHKLSISKQNLNVYLHNLENQGMVIHKGKGWWEAVKSSKISTKYGKNLPPDSIRGHAYVWNVTFKQKIPNWDKRIELLEKNQINYKLVGVLKNIPRIKTLGRRIWLCNDHLRIFDIKDSSYYGKNAIESRNNALNQLYLILSALESKLGVNLKDSDIEWAKEHYALIKNDLAIDQNRKGIIWRISDDSGEWLIIDDSLEQGGELENIGKQAFKTNIPMQKWWNELKETNFEVSPKFILNVMNGIQQNQLIFDRNMKSHLKVLNKIGNAIDKLSNELKKKKVYSRDSQTSLKEFI